MIRCPRDCMGQGFGMYWDSFAHIDEEQYGRDCVRFMDWKTAVMGGEVAHNWGRHEIQPVDNMNDTLTAPEHRDRFLEYVFWQPNNHLGMWLEHDDTYARALQGLAEYQIETLKYWAGMVDGFRCDVAPFLPLAFWEKARKEVAEVNPDCLWLSESVEPAFIREMRDVGLNVLSDGEVFRAFDVCYDYDVFEYFTGYLRGDNTLSAYAEAVNRQETIYPDNYVKLRFLENHDQARVRFLVPDEKSLRSLTAFSFFQKGMAFLYAGQEFGASHRPSLFDKDTVCMKAENGTDLTELIRRMACIKKDPLFTDSTYRVWTSGEDMLTACHSRNGSVLVGVFSLKGKTSPAYVPLPDGYYENLIDGKTVEVYWERVICNGEPLILRKR